MNVLLAAGDAVLHQGPQPFEHYNYWLIIVLMMTGLYVVLSRSNMIKTIIGLNLFQVAVIMFYISMGKITGGTAPIELPALTEAQETIEEMRQHPSGPEAPAPTDIQHVIDLTRAVAATLPDGPVVVSLLGAADDAEALLRAGSGPDGEAKRAQAVEKLDYMYGHVVVYSNPVPHVLMLTAIVVGIATTSLALALVVRINEVYDTIEEDEILALEERV